MSRIRSRLTYANVASSLALFLAVATGGAYAANTIGSADIIDESLLSQDIRNGDVKNADLAADSITSTLPRQRLDPEQRPRPRRDHDVEDQGRQRDRLGPRRRTP